MEFKSSKCYKETTPKMAIAWEQKEIITTRSENLDALIGC
jgi:hypothetical protein